MEGKADMLLANRTLSALIVVCLLVSGFAGFLLLVDSPPAEAAPGDLVVTGTYTIENIVQTVGGDVSVNNGGHLIIRDATLSVISNGGAQHSITVNTGGILTLDHGTITSYLDQINPSPYLNLNVAGGTLEASGSSMLQFPGAISISNNALVNLHDTTITALPEEIVREFVIRSSGGIALDAANDGPAISITSSVVNIYDTTIDMMPEEGTDGILQTDLQLIGTASFLAVNSFISVDFTANSVGAADIHNVIATSDTAHAYLYGCTFEPYSGSNADRVAAITTAIGSGVYIYRWLNATVADEYGVPMNESTITARFTGDTDLEGQLAFYYTRSGQLTTPPVEVLGYLGETAATYRITKDDGRAVIPYLTDVIVDGASASSLFVGTYNFTGNKTILGTDHSSTTVFSLKPYPSMDTGDRSSDFAVKIAGVSVESPDPSRWLVVPPSLLIEGMTYYHAGDVIVAAGGTLTFKDAAFQLVQASANQRSIVVDGTLAQPARLEFVNTVVTSEKAINIIVKGSGVLEAWDTQLQGVNIIAAEDSQVIFHNVTLDGNISTEYGSNSQINIYDSELMQTITLTGNSVGGFTNTSVPSVQVEGDAIAYIYRWIHVTVIDGAGFPCPDATVTARYFISGILAATGISDSTGIARVRSTGTTITSTGSTFVGNYRVNTTLHVHGQDYWAPENISVGVMPYTTPLGRNATYVVMNLPTALPDLEVNAGTAVTVTPDNPRNHEMTTITATVNNVGAVPAHDVEVDFYDVTDTENNFIGTGVIDYIPVDGTGVATMQWQANGDLYPYSHNMTVLVDPRNKTPELNEGVPYAWKVIQIQSLPDVEVRSQASEIGTIPSDVVVNTLVTLYANVHNLGDATTGDVLVQFYDKTDAGTTHIADTTVSGIVQDHVVQATVPWTPSSEGAHAILVFVNGGISGTHIFTEISYDNNEANKSITVLPPPDLVVSNIQFTPSGAIPGGDTLVITATLRNTEVAPVLFTTVALYVDAYPGTIVEDYDITDRLAQNGATTIMFSYVAPVVTVSTSMTFFVVANPTGTTPVELSTSNNMISGSITVLDMRPDLVVTPSGITAKTGTEIKTSSTFGKTVTVDVNVSNAGGRPAYNFTVQVGLRNLSFSGGGSSNYTLYERVHNLSADLLNHTMTVSFVWNIKLTIWANYELWAFVDSEGNVSEPSKSNNFAYTPFEITPLQADVQIVVDKFEFKAGDDVFVSATITYKGTANQPVPSVPFVIFRLVDSTTQEIVPGSDTLATNASDSGVVVQTLTIPQTLDSGSYDIVAVFLDESHPSTSPATLQISAQVSGGLFPWWVWIVIIVVVGAAIGGFTLYTYFYGLGKYVECGECGAFIPAASKRCPKCGVEFEAGTMKCSECGAWIPAESTECPNCGVKFVGEAEEDADYLERMRTEYDEMVSKYRELARPELGKKFSDKAFDEWWRRQPGYITFDDWLAKEEEKKKEGPVPCPVCGTLNPKEATVCHKCGTVFGVQKGAPPSEKKGPPPTAAPAERPAETTATEAAAPGAAPRMVIRRPIEKKVVPKKIIRTPTGQYVEEEQKEGDNNQ